MSGADMSRGDVSGGCLESVQKVCGGWPERKGEHVSGGGTVEPPITDPLRSGQPLYSRQTLCYGLKLL